MHLAIDPDAVRVLKEITGKGVKIGVVTSRHRDTTTAVMHTSRLDEFFTAIACFEDSPRGKPNPDPFLLGAEKLGVKPEDCLAVGDACPDVMSGKAAGMKTALVSSGQSDYGGCAEQPDFRLERLSEVLRIIE